MKKFAMVMKESYGAEYHNACEYGTDNGNVLTVTAENAEQALETFIAYLDNDYLNAIREEFEIIYCEEIGGKYEHTTPLDV